MSSHHVDDSRYSVHHRKEIVSILDGLKKGRVAVELSTSHGKELITSVVEIGSEKNHVYLDASRDERVNSRIIGSKQLTFATQAGILVKWHSTHVSQIKLDDGVAFSILIPAVVQRIQRREYFRLPLAPGGKGIVCRIPFLGKTLEAPIRDISAGGICIALKEPLPPVFSQGTILEGCNIEFPAVGLVHFNLKVCGMRLFQKARGGGACTTSVWNLWI